MLSEAPQDSLTAVVLVGGEGTRLRPFTERIPKPMLPILGRPLLSYTFEMLAQAGVQRAVLSCGYKPDQIESHFGDGYAGLDVEYRIEPTRLGTGGGIRFAAEGLEGSFVALNGDTLREGSLETLLAHHRETNAEATILLTRVEDPSRYGLVRTDDDGRVLGFVEKPSPDEVDTDLINAGLYVLEPSVLDLVAPGEAVSIERDVFPVLAERGTLFALESQGYWLDVGTPESYLQAHFDLLAAHGGVTIAADAEIDDEARVIAPVVIEDGVVVEAGACVGPLTYLGARARVEAHASLRSSVVLPDGAVSSGADLCSAIVAPEAVVALA